ncbi:AMP-binding protein [Nocardia rhamnosiphila]|uniref:AMP-binding protein n=1 Tax=Nocardia rhamnosiphila TaxID=426716 RepID=UPI0004C2B57A|nr:AMP-binding protein [Nocardia rhamnosiphila]
MTVVDDIRSVEPLAVAGPTGVERERILGEWATGVEPYDVSALVTVIRHGHMVPSGRSAARCADEQLTYGDLFDGLDRFRGVHRSSAAPTASGVAALLAEFITASRVGVGRFGRAGLLLGADALAVAVADRRCVAADRRLRRFDPAARPADVRLLALPWGDPQNAVDLLAAWSAGASVVVPTETQRRDPALLAGLIETHGVTQVVADAELPVLLMAEGVDRLPTVARWDLVGTYGGSAPAEAVRCLSPEAVATVAFHSVAYLGAVSRGPLAPTGWTRPVPGAKVLPLDEGRLVPPGVVGDIHVGGRALAAELAAGHDRESFVADPFEPGARLFRTSHRGWWTPEGRLIIES